MPVFIAVDENTIEAARHKHPGSDVESVLDDALRLYIELENANELLPSD